MMSSAAKRADAAVDVRTREEGEGDRSLECWRAVHERFFAEHAAGGFRPDMPGLLERFRLLYPTP